MTPEDQEVMRRIVREEVTAAEQRIREEVTTAEQRIEERAAETARGMQTEILRGLESFARGNFARFHTVESNQTDINTRMAALEERVLYLETRRPPDARA